jgi:hypothetical protein
MGFVKKSRSLINLTLRKSTRLLACVMVWSALKVSIMKTMRILLLGFICYSSVTTTLFAQSGLSENLVYQGLTNTTLGNATESIACCVSNLGSSGQDGLALIITNLGSSGQDGVTISLPGGSSALALAYESLDPSNTLPAGAYIQEQAVGTANGITNVCV